MLHAACTSTEIFAQNLSLKSGHTSGPRNSKVLQNGGTQTLFRNLPKVSNFGETLVPSCSGSKIVPAYKI